MLELENNKKETLSAEELKFLAAKATSKASRKMRDNSDTILVVKNGYLVEENKRGKTKIIRKVSSRKVVPGSRFTINKK